MQWTIVRHRSIQLFKAVPWKQYKKIVFFVYFFLTLTNKKCHEMIEIWIKRSISDGWSMLVTTKQFIIFSHFLSFFSLLIVLLFFIASSYVCLVSFATVPCLLLHFTYRLLLLLLLCIRQPIVIFFLFVFHWSCHFHRENSCFLCSITLKRCCCFFS